MGAFSKNEIEFLYFEKLVCAGDGTVKNKCPATHIFPLRTLFPYGALLSPAHGADALCKNEIQFLYFHKT